VYTCRTGRYKTRGASSFLPLTTFDRINVLIDTHSTTSFSLSLSSHPMPSNWMVSPLRKVLSFSLSLAIYTKDNNLNTKEPLSPFLFFSLSYVFFYFCWVYVRSLLWSWNSKLSPVFLFLCLVLWPFRWNNLMTERPPPLQTKQRPVYNRKRILRWANDPSMFWSVFISKYML
jgi:hypothetical protein